jgi:hypothetical protein
LKHLLKRNGGRIPRDLCFNNRVIQGKSPFSLFSGAWRLFPITQTNIICRCLYSGEEFSLCVPPLAACPAQILIQASSRPFSAVHNGVVNESRKRVPSGLLALSLTRCVSSARALLLFPPTFRAMPTVLIQENNYLGVNIFNEFSSVIAFQPTSSSRTRTT